MPERRAPSYRHRRACAPVGIRHHPGPDRVRRVPPTPRPVRPHRAGRTGVSGPPGRPRPRRRGAAARLVDQRRPVRQARPAVPPRARQQRPRPRHRRGSRAPGASRPARHRRAPPPRRDAHHPDVAGPMAGSREPGDQLALLGDAPRAACQAPGADCAATPLLVLRHGRPGPCPAACSPRTRRPGPAGRGGDHPPRRSHRSAADDSHDRRWPVPRLRRPGARGRTRRRGCRPGHRRAPAGRDPHRPRTDRAAGPGIARVPGRRGRHRPGPLRLPPISRWDACLLIA